MDDLGTTVQAFLDALGDLTLAQRVAIYNDVARRMQAFLGVPHPVSGVQFIPADQVVGNTYNPNTVAPPELRLLRTSLRKDGVTMPIVAARAGPAEPYIVVDGFHRTTLLTHDPDLAASLGGYIPLVELHTSLEERMASTVRHNLARGTHQVELSAKLVTALSKHHWSNSRISAELGMDPDEVLRLKQITGLAEAFRDRDFSQAWE